MNSYPTPRCFVTVKKECVLSEEESNLSSQKVIETLERRIKDRRRRGKNCEFFDDLQFKVFSTGEELREEYGKTVSSDRTVVFFDTAPDEDKAGSHQPLSRTQKSSFLSRDNHQALCPGWAESPMWAVKVNRNCKNNKVAFRNCINEVEAWFYRRVKEAKPGVSYPWGDIPKWERNKRIRELSQTVS